MNKLITFQLSIIFGLFLFLSSCETMNQDGSGEQPEVKNNLSSCVQVDGPIDSLLMITPGNYHCMVDNYNKNGNHFSAFDDGKKVRGFKIDHIELNQMLSVMKDPANAEVFIMMGIELDERGKEVPHAVFVVKDDTAEGNETGGKDKTTYFDFSAPCPDYCP